MTKPNLEILPVKGSKLPSPMREAVLFFSESDDETPGKKAKKNPPTITGLGSRPAHSELLPRLAADKILSGGEGSLALHDKEEVVFHALGSRREEPVSALFRLDSLCHRFRMAGGEVSRLHLQSLKHRHRHREIPLVIDLSHLASLVTGEWERLVGALIEGIHLGSYQYQEYKTAAVPMKDFRVILLFLKPELERLKKSACLSRGRIISEGVGRARDLVNAPPNDLDSESFVRAARKIAGDLKSVCRVYGNEQLKKMKLNALLGVNAGSKVGAKLVVMDNRFSGRGKKILLVGKGVLFDSGGLSLKPSASMVGMKMDMAGAAAVLSAFEAMVKLKTPARIIAITPLTDNMTGGNAMKVGDVLRTHSGKTVEVLNTDAEGRLILCDALSYGIETYRPDYILDLATLTGACLVALGVHYAGLFTPGDDLAQKLLSSSQATDEPLWRLPLDHLYLKDLQSDIADLKNIGSSYGGAITAAKFLEQFIPKKYLPGWAHLDIAPVMDYNQTKGYQIKGGSGFGVRLIIDFVERWVGAKPTARR